MPYDEYGGSQWEGGSPNVNRAYQRMVEAGQAPDNSWLDRLFQRKQAPITQQPLPPMVPTDEGRFPAEPAPSPFGGGNAGQRARPKPASKLSSADEIAQRAGQFMSPWTTQGGSDPEAQANGQFMSPWTTQGSDPAVDEPLMRDPGETGGWPEPTPRQRVDMRGDSSAGMQQNQTFWDLLKQTQGMGDLKRLLDLIRGSGSTPDVSSIAGGGLGGGIGFAAAASLPQDTSPFGGFMPTQFPRYDYRSPLSSFSIPEMNPEWQALNHSLGSGTRAVFGHADGGFIDNLPVPDEIDIPHPPAAATPVPPLINPPQAAPPAGGGGGGGDSGIGGIANLAMTLLPMFLKDGGAVGLMRGGYPELYNAPIRHFDSGGANYVDGYGNSDGRSDQIDARLSPKEYVVDAETMSMLGDGNPDAGAKKMDQFRSNVRRHKGKALAKGKFSPNAKNPAEYLIGNPMSDGLARLSRSKK